MPTTIGDVIAQKKQTDLAETQAMAAAAAADQAYAAAQAAADASDDQLKLALGRTGPAFVQNTDGSIEVYLPDSSVEGFQVVTPVAVGAVVDLTPAPTPAPAPTPTPAPQQ
jgi:hypothetical protein